MTVRSTPEPIRYEELALHLPEGPVDLATLISGSDPLEIDIGFGRGRSFLERARQRVTRVLGVEIKAKWAYRVEQRRRSEHLENALAIRADARELLSRAGPDGAVRRVFVHFPDPWWKKRHAKRKVVGTDLLDDLARLLERDGELYIQTDVEERAQEYESLLEAHPAFAPVAAPTFRVMQNPYGARSNREVRADEDGLPIYRLCARRITPR